MILFMKRLVVSACLTSIWVTLPCLMFLVAILGLGYSVSQFQLRQLSVDFDDGTKTLNFNRKSVKVLTLWVIGNLS